MLRGVRGVLVVPNDPRIVAAARAEGLAVDVCDECDIGRALQEHSPAMVVAREAALPTIRASFRGTLLGLGTDADVLCRAGADDVLIEPFDEAEARCRMALARRIGNREYELNAALSAAGIGTFEIDLASGRVGWSDVMFDVMGMPRDHFDGSIERSMEKIHPADQERLRKVLESLVTTTTPTTEEYRVVDDDGHVRTLHACATSVRGGSLHRLVGTVVDVTERKEAEDTLRRTLAEVRATDERFRIVARATSDLVWDWDLISDVVTWSDNIESLFGYRLRQTPITWWEEVMHPEDRKRVADGIRALIELGEEDWQDEYRMKRADGSYATVYDRGVVIHDAGGRAVRMIGAIMDISERREMQARLLLADRMASVGTLAAGVAHEINNPLAYVIANVDIALSELRKVPNADRLISSLREAKEGTERVRRIVGDLKTFSRADDAVRERVDLRSVVESSINLAMIEIRHRAKLVRELGDAPRVDANAGRLGQVVVNLLVNAAQAIEEGAVDRNTITVRTRTDDAGHAVLEIKDTGPGMPPEIRARIFDPFYTTKAVGEGTGLGLTICHGIVAALGGSIEVESDVGHGSLFRVVLPAARESDRVQRAMSGTAPPTEPRRGRVLVIDDEPMIGKAVKLMLDEVHEVTPLVSAREALERLSAGETFDAIVCDLMMPEMTGMDLYAEATKRFPELARKFVFLTGGAFTPRARAFLESVGNARLEKPFDASALIHAIGSAMRRSREEAFIRGAFDRGT
jgi:PAS domain S-box-containing protein